MTVDSNGGKIPRKFVNFATKRYRTGINYSLDAAQQKKLLNY